MTALAQLYALYSHRARSFNQLQRSLYRNFIIIINSSNNSSNTHQAEKFGLETVRPALQGATFGMRGQLYHGHYLSHYVMEGRGRR